MLPIILIASMATSLLGLSSINPLKGQTSAVQSSAETSCLSAAQQLTGIKIPVPGVSSGGSQQAAAAAAMGAMGGNGGSMAGMAAAAGASGGAQPKLSTQQLDALRKAFTSCMGKKGFAVK